MGPQFFQTGMGQKFFEVTVPRMVKALERIADSLEEANARERKTPPPTNEPARGMIVCDDCKAHVRGPRLLREAGLGCEAPEVLAEHAIDCKWAMQVKRGCEGA